MAECLQCPHHLSGFKILSSQGKKLLSCQQHTSNRRILQEDNKITIGGKTATLAQIEHNLLRRDFRDPRTHFAVVPAAVGGAAIERVAFSAPGLDQWLDRKAREYLGSPRNVRVDTKSGTIYVPQLFRWFPLDFAKSVGLGRAFPPPTDDQIIVAYLRKKGSSDLHAQIDRIGKKDEEIKVIYEPFDWTLNDLCPENPDATKKAASKPALYISPRVLSVESVEKK
ncbi:MAG: DUF547 domain-containing protein [Cyanobacteriota/Melainabacteria group bacterium]